MKEPWFSLIATGAKRFEGRLGDNALAALTPGSEVVWTNDELPFPRYVRTELVGVRRFPTFAAMLTECGVANVLPTVPDVDGGVSVYRVFYKEADERAKGVACLEMRVLGPVSRSPH